MTEPYYERDGITIYHGDCREILPTLGTFDLLLTDPPYGLARFNNGQPTRVAKTKNGADGRIAWDVKPSRQLLNTVLDVAELAIIWGANNLELPVSEYFFVWDKQQTVPNFASAELAYTNIKQPAQVFRYGIHKHMQTTKQHPTQKPLPLMQWCLQLAGDVSTVIDPFMGSGTTLVAAKLAGIQATGIELEERYCEIAANRLRQGVLPFAE